MFCFCKQIEKSRLMLSYFYTVTKLDLFLQTSQPELLFVHVTFSTGSKLS